MAYLRCSQLKWWGMVVIACLVMGTATAKERDKEKTRKGYFHDEQKAYFVRIVDIYNIHIEGRQKVKIPVMRWGLKNKAQITKSFSVPPGRQSVAISYYAHGVEYGYAIRKVFDFKAGHYYQCQGIHSVAQWNWRLADTSVLMAVRIGDEELLKTFLSEGMPVDIKVYGTGENGNRTPLYWAVKAGNANLVRILLNHGANPNIKCSYGAVKKFAITPTLIMKSPIELAKFNNNQEILDLLEEAAHKGQGETEASPKL